MTSKQENDISDNMGVQQKKLFFADLFVKHKELAKRQRDYKEILGKRHKTRGDTIIEKSLWKANDALLTERNDLRAQIWVADGAQHLHENDKHLKEIQCHVDCQEHLGVDISQLKVAIGNMERELSRADREIYELNRKIVPENQHQEHVARMRKKVGLLQNQLEVGVRRECIFSSENAQLRLLLENIQHERAQFNEIYTKLVNNLNSDKKYMMDLVEYALNTFENCINVSEKTNNRSKKIQKEQEARKSEVGGLIRTSAANEAVGDFVGTKSKVRPVAPLQPKEVRRRDNYRNFHTRRINLYEREIQKLLEFANAHTVFEVIEKFQQHESLYYSYFSLDNERGFHITLLNNSVEQLCNQVEGLRHSNKRRTNKQIAWIEELEFKLIQHQKRSDEIAAKVESTNELLRRYLLEMQSIFLICRVNPTPLFALLGDHTRMSIVNFKRFTKLLEMRIIDILASVYMAEHNDPDIKRDKYTVKDIEKTLEAQTKLPDIVLTQQCPECAEGEAFTADDTTDGGTAPLTVDEAKKALFDKVNQPEMQYRLHSISQCRLPRSRILAAHRNA